MVYVGIDNGVGTVGVIESKGSKIIDYYLFKTPVVKEKDFCKTNNRVISRLNFIEFYSIIKRFIDKDVDYKIFIERPLINPKMFFSTLSSIRIYEAICVIFDFCNLRFTVVDSKEWQKYFFGKVKGRDKKKKLNKEIGREIFSKYEDWDEFDGLFIAKYYFEVDCGNK